MTLQYRNFFHYENNSLTLKRLLASSNANHYNRLKIKQ